MEDYVGIDISFHTKWTIQSDRYYGELYLQNKLWCCSIKSVKFS